MVAGTVSVPLSLTPANARSPMRFKLAGKKAEVSVVWENAASESNAFAAISTTLNALAGTPLPLYPVLEPPYVDGIPGNVPQTTFPYMEFAGLMPVMANVLSATETTK